MRHTVCENYWTAIALWERMCAALRASIFVAAAMVVGASNVAAQRAASEYEVKAAFVYNFLKYVDWPPAAFARPDSAMLIGVVGDDPFGRTLNDTVEGKRIGQRSIEIVRSRELRDLRSCHLVFISPSEKDALRRWFSGFDGAAVLTVSDMDGFAEAGGMIRLTLQGNKVRFEINLDAARQQNLQVSAKLLSLATIVGPKPSWN